MKRIITVCILLALGIFGAIAAKTGMFIEYETQFAHFVNPNAQSSVFFRIFSELGEVYGVVAVVAILLLLKNRLVLGLPAGISVLIGWTTNEILKRIVMRPRPEEALRLLDVGGYSFPSGHAMSNAALYAAIIYCAFRLLKTDMQKTVCAVLLSLFTLLIALSRIYFNVHYLIDVVSGLLIGTAVALIICPLIIKIVEKRKRV